MFPQWYEFGALGMEAAIRAALAPEAAAEWSVALPCHCAVGTKP
jgi:hypothetical protein